MAPVTTRKTSKTLKTTTPGNKAKYHHSVLTIDNPTTSAMDEISIDDREDVTNTHTDTLQLPSTADKNQIDILASLKGYGHNNRAPMFSGVIDKFHSWLHKLDCHLLLNGLYDAATDSEPVNKKLNVNLYLCIAMCLDNEPFDLISNSAHFDGRLAYRLLKEKYQGNKHARKAAALVELAQLSQGETESVHAYISRGDIIIYKLEQFKVFNDTSFYVIIHMQGLQPRFATFKATISTADEIPEWNTYKLKLSSHDQLQKVPAKASKVMTVGVNNAAPKIQKPKQTNKFKKFVKKPKCTFCFSTDHTTQNCTSSKWCGFCGNASHYLRECRNRNNPANSNQRGRGAQNSRGGNRNNNSNRGRGSNRGQSYGRKPRGNFSQAPAVASNFMHSHINEDNFGNHNSENYQANYIGEHRTMFNRA